MKKRLYLGVMSGTSLDGIDIALIEINQSQINYVSGEFFPYQTELRQLIEQTCHDDKVSLQSLGELQVRLSLSYADAINSFLAINQLNPSIIEAIGCHGQTVYHQPNSDFPFSLQLVDPSLLAAKTNIPAVTDFRSMDIVLGGQGAPLIPAFHQALLGNGRSNNNKALLNIGGMANVTLFEQDQVFGFDTGPGNVLIDLWVQKYFDLPYDADGKIAREGTVDEELLDVLLSEPYFSEPFPKSTGREYFNLTWLEDRIPATTNESNVVSTLTALTAKTVAEALLNSSKQGELILFGGGSHNKTLLTMLKQYLPNWHFSPSNNLGIPADYMEAAAFAWFAYLRMNEMPLQLSSVTGAKNSGICGVVALPPASSER
ncbi:MAG: anhydro-N-acetylmuramic acid kinase [Gammaproteobacteria bacterium]|nr:anhydro-N-acetylmuramic acid kinase [Gammaproteobacteria bacterium]